MTRKRQHDADDNAGEYWRDVKSFRQGKRADNRVASARIVRESGFVVEEFNHGAHLVVRHGGHVVDFWPSTGLWIDRDTPRDRRRGVFPLVDHLNRKGAT